MPDGNAMLVENDMSAEILVPVLMCVALLWWIGRGMSVRAMSVATAVTLVVIVAVLMVSKWTGY
jgi:FtsH-binding integral membrane protein